LPLVTSTGDDLGRISPHSAAAHRVDAAVDRAQASSAKPGVDRAASQAEFDQLAPRDHSVLAGGKRRERSLALQIRSPSVLFGLLLRLTIHMKVKLRSARSLPL